MKIKFPIFKTAPKKKISLRGFFVTFPLLPFNPKTQNNSFPLHFHDRENEGETWTLQKVN